MEQLLIASTGVAMIASIVLVLRAFIEVRRFGSYLKSNHPRLWSELVPTHGFLEEAVSLGFLSFDATPAVSEFRKQGFRNHGDPELAARCVQANRAERTGILSWFGLLAWALVGLAIIALKRSL